MKRTQLTAKCALIRRDAKRQRLRLLAAHGVKATWETLTDRIMNRAGDGPCPMESAVSGTDDIAEAFGLIAAKLDAMRGANK